jgi:DNA-binding transcriptional MerR regulator
MREDSLYGLARGLRRVEHRGVGEDRIRGKDAGESGWVTTRVAAEALGVDPRTVRTYIRRGLLQARVEGEGVEKAYSVDVDSLHGLRDARNAEGKRPHKTRAKSADAEDFVELIRDLTAQVVEASTEAADLRTRLQLSERAQSSVEEEARTLREERDRLRSELEAERSKGFWARLFGG